MNSRSNGNLPNRCDNSLQTETAPGTVTETVTRLSELALARGMTVFTVIDHSGEATRHGLDLRDTKVVVFGSPLGGTPVMVAAPLAALDLPLKVLVWADEGGQTRVSYVSPAALAARSSVSTARERRVKASGMKP